MAVAEAVDDRPARRPEAVVAAAVVRREAGALVQARRKEDAEVVAAKLAIGVKLALAERGEVTAGDPALGDAEPHHAPPEPSSNATVDRLVEADVRVVDH